MKHQVILPPLLRMEDIWAGYSQQSVLKGASLSIEQGQIYGLLGINGAGKSTLMRAIMELLPITRGHIQWQGKKISSKGLVGGVIETPRLYQHLSIGKHIEIFAGYHGISTNEAFSWLEAVGLKTQSDLLVGKCSWGMRQRLTLALTLLSEPKLVILDEPSNGLDPKGQKDFCRMVQYLNHTKGISFLIASHHFDELETLAHKVGILHQGQICWEGNIKNAPQSVVFTSRARSAPLVYRLLAEKQLPFQQIDQEHVKVQVRLPSDIGMLAKHFVMHGIELLGIEPQQPSLADIYWKHTQTLVA